MSPRSPSTILAVAMLVLLSRAVQAQTPPAPAETPPPATQPAPAPPPAAQPPVAAQPGPVQAADPFGEETTLTPKTIVFMKGNATWDTAFETLLDAYKSVYAYLDKQGLKASGPAMTVYTATDDTGFQYQAAVPLAEAPKNPPRGDISVGTSPGGKALKFVHRGSYDAMDTTYEAITNYLDEKRLEANDMFVEEYVTDPLKTPEDQLIVNVYVPVK
jgi:effector-binding domain-containing protein